MTAQHIRVVEQPHITANMVGDVWSLEIVGEFPHLNRDSVNVLDGGPFEH